MEKSDKFDHPLLGALFQNSQSLILLTLLDFFVLLQIFLSFFLLRSRLARLANGLLSLWLCLTLDG